MPHAQSVNIPWKTRFDMTLWFHLAMFPNLAAGMITQQLTAYARKRITCVQNGVKKRLPPEEILDQSRERFRNPIPPKPLPMKFAVALCGATQQRKARDPSMGKTNSGRNCHTMTPPRTAKKIFICFLERRVGCSLCFFWVSNSAAWQSLYTG